MDDKTRSLIKKHIRMLDYMRADMVAILGQQPENPATAPKPIDIYDKPPISPLYQNFEAAKAGVTVISEADMPSQARLPRHATANIHPDTGRILPIVEGEAHFPVYGFGLFEPLMKEIIAAGFAMHDGPKVAYFWADAQGHLTIDGEGKRYDYHEIDIRGNDRESTLLDFATRIRHYLAEQTGKAILWRVRPELSYEADHSPVGTRWCAYARLVVVPA